MRLRAQAGADRYVLDLHRQWLGDLSGSRVLDLGCFWGNALSMEIAAGASEYIGIDLSEQAIEVLNEKLSAAGLPSARGEAIDFLANGWPDGYFDAVYAYSVLHHFADLDTALLELKRIVRPGGVIVTFDPMATEPLNRLARAIYRPVQTDRDWEFPFNRGTFHRFARYFRIEELHGIQGVIKLSYPLLMLPATEGLGRRLASRLLSWEDRHARSFGLPFYISWHASMKLRRPDAS